MHYTMSRPEDRREYNEPGTLPDSERQPASMDSKLAEESRKALIAEAKRLTREERLRAFARHSKLVTELSDAGKRARSKRRGRS
jgi:hypothetical protein